MLVPAAVVELHTTHAPFEQPAGEQTVGSKRARPAGRLAVIVECLCRLPRKIRQFRDRSLHPERHLVLRDPRGDLGIAGLQPLPVVERCQTIEHRPSQTAIDARGIGEEENRVAGTAELHPLMVRRQETGPPEAFEEALIGVLAAPVRDEDDERREVLCLAP